MEQLELMCHFLGTPGPAIWPKMVLLPNYGSWQLPRQPYSSLEKHFRKHGPTACDLLSRMLTYDPEKRMTAIDALAHEYFRDEPFPTTMEEMPVLLPSKTDAQL